MLGAFKNTLGGRERATNVGLRGGRIGAAQEN